MSSSYRRLRRLVCVAMAVPLVLGGCAAYTTGPYLAYGYGAYPYYPVYGGYAAYPYYGGWWGGWGWGWGWPGFYGGYAGYGRFGGGGFHGGPGGGWRR
jgi:hypothetical protein